MNCKAFCLFKKFAFGIFIIFTYWSCTSDGEENPSVELTALEIYDQSYGSEPIQSMDVYLPADRSTEETPLLIYIHGGAWISGNKNEFADFRNALVESFPDYAFVSIGYRLYNPYTQTNPFPAQQQDIKNALSYILDKTEEWQISKKIILSGASAGGYLALLHAYKHQSTGNPKAVIVFFPPTDLAALHNFSEFTKQGLTGMLGGTPQENPDAYAINSPITYIKPISPPTILFHGSTDSVVPLSQSELLGSALNSAGVDYELVKIEAQGHGFTIDTYPPLFKRAADFVEKALK